MYAVYTIQIYIYNYCMYGSHKGGKKYYKFTIKSCYLWKINLYFWSFLKQSNLNCNSGFLKIVFPNYNNNFYRSFLLL